MKQRARKRPKRLQRRPTTTVEIAPNGHIRGLWNDDLALTSLGPCVVRRVSYVEFSYVRQVWCVRDARPSTWLGRLLRRLFGWPAGGLLHTAPSRSQALAWEQGHFKPGSSAWQRLTRR